MTNDIPLNIDIDQVRAELESAGQTHLLAFWEELDASQKQSLLQQIREIDFDLVTSLLEDTRDDADWTKLAEQAVPPPAIRLGDTDSLSHALTAGESALRSGHLGVVLVAGGQGSRLGFPHPKGMYEIGPVSNRSLFQIHVEHIRAIANRYDVSIPLYLMTSPATHAETVECFKENDNFGLPSDDLHLFCQGTMPAVSAETGKLLLADKDKIFCSPDGHGGMLRAFAKSGCLDDAQGRGIKHLYYFQVDNPIASICDLRLVGFHVSRESEMTTQVVAKTDALEKVGNVVVVDDRMMVIEYSDLPDSSARQTDRNGNLTLWAGSIAVHVFDVDFLRAESENASSLPFHRAVKAVPHIDSSGSCVEPSKPNAIKFERFIFDLMPSAKNAIVVEDNAERVFAPLKNASGSATDTPETTRAAIVRKSRQMLEQAGATVADDVQVEISPLFAMDVEELKSKIEPGMTINSDTYFGPS